MSKTNQIDDLDAGEIDDINYFYSGNADRKTFRTADDLIRWLNE